MPGKNLFANAALAAAWLVTWCLAGCASAANHNAPRATDAMPPLPATPAEWVNSSPLSVESLHGKAAVFWFFEETCPNCRRKWPELIELARKYEGQPIAFIGVNSGTTRQDVQQYAQRVGVKWPLIVDASRQFEQACGIPEINLQNVCQAAVLTPDGRLRQGNWADLEGTAAKALVGAHWNVEPEGIPDSLHAAWVAIELGNFTAAAKAVQTGLKSKRPEVRAAAEKLTAAVDKEIQSSLAAARADEQAGHAWSAYKTYLQAKQRFAGYELPDEFEAGRKKLAGDPEVVAALAASKAVEQARRQLGSRNAAAQQRAIDALKKLIADSPESDAALEAQQLLQASGAN